jgi:hypothetical protein
MAPMALSYRMRAAEHLNRPENGYLGEKVQESVCPPVDFHVLVYNMKRVINLVGTKRLLETI